MTTEAPERETYEPDPDAPNEDPLGPELVMEAQVQDAHVTRKQNGATYVVVFEVPLENLQGLADAGDGHTVVFKGKEVGKGADIKRIGITKDADNNRHVKLSCQFPQSEIVKSLGRLGGYIAHDAEGELRLIPEHVQTSLELTTRAE